jgi:plastocyanin
MKLDKRCLILVVFVTIAAFVTGCQSQPTLATDPVPGIGVEISSDQCPNVEVKSGEQVTWTNTDNHVHMLRHKPGQGDVQFVSGDIQPGDSFTFLFVEPGTYLYECSEGTGVYGIVVVRP